MTESNDDLGARIERIRLSVERIELRGRHGVYPAERRSGNTFHINVDIEGDVERSVASDRLDETIDFAEVVRLVRRISRRQSFSLIESLAGAIADGLLERFSAAQRVVVRVAKVNPPGLGRVACTSAEVVKSRT